MRDHERYVSESQMDQHLPVVMCAYCGLMHEPGEMAEIGEDGYEGVCLICDRDLKADYDETMRLADIYLNRQERG